MLFWCRLGGVRGEGDVDRDEEFGGDKEGGDTVESDPMDMIAGLGRRMSESPTIRAEPRATASPSYSRASPEAEGNHMHPPCFNSAPPVIKKSRKAKDVDLLPLRLVIPRSQT
jgi:hypothetical protein